MYKTYLTTLHPETDADVTVAGTLDEIVVIDDVVGMMGEVVCVTADGSSERIDTSAEATAAQTVSLTRAMFLYDDSVRG